MIIFPLITTWMWFEVAIAVQSLSNNALRKLVAGPTAFIFDECVHGVPTRPDQADAALRHLTTVT
jgi:hypothetical protein